MGFPCALSMCLAMIQRKSEDEDPDARKKRAKIMKGRFKRKLERLKFSTAQENENENGLLSCKSPGVLLLSALASADKKIWGDTEKCKWWIENNCNIFDFKEEMECDLTPSVSVVGDHATISVGEIKNSIHEYSHAKKQMVYQVRLLLLRIRRGRLSFVVFSSITSYQ